MRTIGIGALAILGSFLSGCATTAASPPANAALMAECAVIDCVKMQRVEREARMRGVTVVWLHPPAKKTAIQ